LPGGRPGRRFLGNALRGVNRAVAEDLSRSRRLPLTLSSATDRARAMDPSEADVRPSRSAPGEAPAGRVHERSPRDHHEDVELPSLSAVKAVARTIRDHLEGIITAFVRGVTNAPRGGHQLGHPEAQVQCPRLTEPGPLPHRDLLPPRRPRPLSRQDRPVSPLPTRIPEAPGFLHFTSSIGRMIGVVSGVARHPPARMWKC